METSPAPAAPAVVPRPSFLVRHQFVIYRLFSLSGLIPVGAYLVVHLVTNASILNGPMSFQDLRRLWRAKKIGRDDYVWTAGMPQWREIRRLGGMSDALSS